MQGIRTHDSLYLKENRKQTPKEYFKFIVKEAAPFIENIDKPSILDVGCATGDFLWYLSGLYPSVKFTGLDVMPELIERAKKEVPTANFILGNINTAEGLPSGKFDAVFMLGVHSIFDDFEPCFNNFLKLIKDGGRGYIFGIFNPSDLDVLVKARRSGDNGAWEAGWNLFSKRTVSKFLEDRSYAHTFKDWAIAIDLPPNPQDHLRSWTFRLADGSRMIVNGMQLLHYFSLLEIGV